MFFLNRACEMQVASLSAGKENIYFPDKKIMDYTLNEANNYNKEGIGAKELDAIMRLLDKTDPSYRL